MKILLVVGSCLTVNSSANLCHSAYLKGLVEAGYTVDVLSVSEKDQIVDSMIKMPEINNHYTYYGLSMYEKLSAASRRNGGQDQSNKDLTTADKEVTAITKIKLHIKKMVRDIYGVYGVINAGWFRRAKSFKSNTQYDLVISLSFPATSHRLVHYLRNKGSIKCSRWVQIWEDPWGNDFNFEGWNRKAILEEEERLVSYPDKVIYVSPLTLSYQQDIFGSSKKHMSWLPLPSYYNVEQITYPKDKNNRYGYFGDYSPRIRHLEPFYKAASNLGIDVTICGNPYGLFDETDAIDIYPRVPLDQLKKHEDESNILVFLCNHSGGQIPGKLYQYSATNKMILFILDGTEEEQQVLKDYFSKYNRYVFCHNDEASITQAIMQIENNEVEGISSEPLDCFSPSNIAADILKVSIEGV